MIRRFFQVLSYVVIYLYLVAKKETHQTIDLIFSAVSNLGGLYVKLIQFICLRTDIFGEEEKMRFLSFYDAVPVQPLSVDTILKAQLGQGTLSQFMSITPTPFASGTFGQVYRATLTDGTDVVIKILRPGVRRKLFVDFMILKAAAFVFNLFHYQRIIDVHQLLREFEELTYRELDYTKEVQSAAYFYESYRNHPFVVIPKTFAHLSTSTVLVQEYIGGVPLTDLIVHRIHSTETNLRLTQEELRAFLRRMAYELGIQGMTQDIFYADPHPGNIKLMPGNRFAFIDFGIVGTSPPNRRTYYHIVELLLAHSGELDMKRIGTEFLQWGAGDFYKQAMAFDRYQGDKDRSLVHLITDKYAVLLESYRERFRQIEAVEEENFAKMYLEIIRAGELLGVKIPEGMLASMRTIAIYKSWASVIDPDYHYMRDVYRQILGAVDKKYIYNADEVSPKSMNMEEALEGVLEWVSRVAEKDYPWYYQVDKEIGNLYA